MAGIDNLDSMNAASSRPPATSSADLAKLESQLSDWVHCPSSKTSAGKAKIAEITDKIEAIKVQVKKTEDVKLAPVPDAGLQASQANAAQALRFDGLGAWVNEQA